MLEVSGIRKVYDGHGRRVEAIGDLTFSVGEGEFVCVVLPQPDGPTTHTNSPSPTEKVRSPIASTLRPCPSYTMRKPETSSI